MSAPSPPRWPKTPPPRVVESPRIARLATAGPAAVDAFWRDLRTPLVEPVEGAPDERIVTFLWRGEARAVALLANKLTDPSVWEHSVLERLPGTDVWHRSYRLGSAWRATYRLAVDDGREPLEDAAAGPASRWRGLAARAIPDPLNPRCFPGKDVPSSVAELPDAPPQPWSEPRAGIAAGRVSEHAVAGRRLWLHEPPTPQGLLVLLDGDDWVARLGAPHILDNLLADGAIPPLATLMIDSVDAETRWRELSCDPAFVGHLTGAVLPWARERHGLVPDPARTLIAGQSLGGLTALYAAVRAPRTFGGAIALSASLWWAPPGEEPGRLVRDVVARPTARFHLEVGSEEWVLLGYHRALRDRLREHGADPGYVEYQGGHDALCWRGGLADGLVRLTRGW